MLLALSIIAGSVIAYLVLAQWGRFRNFKSKLMFSLISNGMNHTQADDLYTKYLHVCHKMHGDGVSADEIANHIFELSEDDFITAKLKLCYAYCKELSVVLQDEYTPTDIANNELFWFASLTQQLDSFVSHLKYTENILIEDDSRGAKLVLAYQEKSLNKEQFICTEIMNAFNAQKSDMAREECLFYMFWPTIFKSYSDTSSQ